MKKIFLFIFSYLLVITCSANTNSDTITFQMLEDNKVVVNATFCDSISDLFALDNGSVFTILDKDFFYQNFDTSKFKLVSNTTWAGVQVYEGNFNVSIGNHKFTVNHITLKNLSNLGESAKNGIIGSQAFVDVITTIDFENKTILFQDSLPDVTDYIKIPLFNLFDNKTSNRCIYVEGLNDKKNRPIRAKMMIDLGAANNIFAITLYNKINKNQIKNIEKSKGNLGGFNGSALMDVYFYNIDTVKIENNVFEYIRFRSSSFPDNKNVDLFNVFGETGLEDGLIGTDFLKNFITILDYKNNYLYLK